MPGPYPVGGGEQLDVDAEHAVVPLPGEGGGVELLTGLGVLLADAALGLPLRATTT